MAESVASKRPAEVAEDAWARMPEIVERHRRAAGCPRYVLGPEDLEKISRDAEDAHAAGHEYKVSVAELEAMQAAHLKARTGQNGQAPGR